MQPGRESIWVAKRSKIAPRGDQRALHGVVGLIDIAQDAKRDRHAFVADEPSQLVECFGIAAFRPVNECSAHRTLPIRRRSAGFDGSHSRCCYRSQAFNLEFARRPLVTVVRRLRRPLGAHAPATRSSGRMPAQS